MCGICGVIDFSGSGNAAALVRRMNPTMVHRGPDDEGYLANHRLALGMRRLSIIDLAGGHQPIFNESGTVGAVLNGEIYNFQELRKQLEDRNHRFLTRSDSEVVAHSYEEWGADCVERFQGMFALAVWDGRRAKGEGRKAESQNAGEGARGPSEGATLFLARDRLGIKPLYYFAGREQRAQSKAQSARNDESIESHFSALAPGPSRLAPGSVFLFASEVRTLLASGAIPRQLSRTALESYLLFGSVSEPMTLVEGVLSLLPGHRMTIDMGPAGAKVEPESYWNVATQIANRTQSSSNGNAKRIDLRAAAGTVRSLLEESVRKHLIADVPIGVFLSSGIDSTTLAALASREVPGVHTFTVAFPEKEFSEAGLARRTAEKLGTTHQEVMLSGDEMLGRLPGALGALDQPSMDGINTYLVSWSARQAGLKVALSGLGGDEVFGGYSTFRRTAHYQRIAALGNRVPSGLRAAVAAAAGTAGAPFVSADAARKFAGLWTSPESLPDPFYFGRALFTPTQVSGLMNRATDEPAEPLWWKWLSESAAQTRNLDPFAAVSCMELQSYLVSTLLRDTDSMSMAHSLEVRVPFLDHPLVEFVTQLPEKVKLGKGTPKALLITALGDLLPAEVVEQKKRGFTFPWANWLRGPLREQVERGLAELSPALEQTLDRETAQAVWGSYLDGKTTWSRPWGLYALNEWSKRHLA